jgi:hypothetical protein
MFVCRTIRYCCRIHVDGMAPLGQMSPFTACLPALITLLQYTLHSYPLPTVTEAPVCAQSDLR